MHEQNNITNSKKKIVAFLFFVGKLHGLVVVLLIRIPIYPSLLRICKYQFTIYFQLVLLILYVAIIFISTGITTLQYIYQNAFLTFP